MYLCMQLIMCTVCVCSFGGGPTVNRLSACKPCVQETERLHRRQQMEKQAFLEVCSVSLLHSECVLNILTSNLQKPAPEIPDGFHVGDPT